MEESPEEALALQTAFRDPALFLPDDHPTLQSARMVLERLAHVSGLEHMHWDLHIVNAPGKSFMVF